jgi:hypothetical protein
VHSEEESMTSVKISTRKWKREERGLTNYKGFERGKEEE